MKNLTPFTDSNGNEVLPGDRIRILGHYTYDFLIGQEAALVWNKEQGMYEFHYENTRRGKVFKSKDNFYGVHKFEKI